MNTTEISEQPLTAPVRRIDLVDALRGFALMGIIVVNAAHFATSYTRDLGLTDPQGGGLANDLAAGISAAVFEGKFYLLFAFLFGYSFVLQEAVAQRAGANFEQRTLRRMAGLFVIGLLHLFFLWHGDILTLYAGLGVLLLAFRSVKPNVAVIIGLSMLAVLAAFEALASLALALSGEEWFDKAESLETAQTATVAFSGGFGDVLAERVSQIPYFLFAVWFGQGFPALAMMFLGLAAARLGLLESPNRHRPILKRMLIVGLAIGVPTQLAYAATAFVAPDSTEFVVILGLTAGFGVFLTAAYVSGFALAVGRRAGDSLIALLAPVGRMALSNYVIQSVALGLVFFGYGLGLHGEVGPAATLAISLGIFALQIPFSHFWMGTHTYGPLEWPLRAVTNWERPTWRKPVKA